MNTAVFSTRLVTSTSDADQHAPRHDAPRHQVTGERALVLGGGGAAGNAWVIGVLAGLTEGGLDVTRADLIVGTSSGSTAAAQVGSATPADLLAEVLATPPQRRPGSGGGRPTGPADSLERTGRIIAAAGDPADMRRRLGAAALAMDATADDSRDARWRATVAARLPSQDWPPRPVLITAVDARTGEPVVFDGSSGVDLADAVAASCAGGGFTHGIGDRRYIDGGYRRSSENADLAAGCARVLVLSPLGGRTRAPLDWGMQLAVQVEELRAGGSRVETILPDDTALRVFGDNMMDLSRRPDAARAGYDQGRALAGQLGGFWR